MLALAGGVLDEAIPLEAPERHVDLTRVQRRQEIAELLLERLLQLVSVGAPPTQECEKELPHR